MPVFYRGVGLGVRGGSLFFFFIYPIVEFSAVFLLYSIRCPIDSAELC